MKKVLLLSTLFLGTCLATKAEACTTVVVGREASHDHSTLVARNEDVSTHHAKYFKVYPHKERGERYFHSNINNFQITLPARHYRYTGVPDWNEKEGRFLEAGINEKNVAMSATESAKTNEKMQKIDPFVKDGIDEASMLNVVLPFIDSPREGVRRLGKIVEEKGSTAANGIIFSNDKEIWYMEIGSGHQWVAQRVPDRCYAVIPNKLVLGKIDFNNSKDFMYAKGLKSFAKRHHLFKKGELNFKQAFGTNDADDKKYNYPRMWAGQRLLTPSKKQAITQTNFKTFMRPDHKIKLEDVMRVLGDHFDGTIYDTYGQNKGNYRAINVATNVESHILQLRPNKNKKIKAVQWLAMASPATSVYVPFYTNIKQTPDFYQKGTDKYQVGSAYWTYKLTTTLANTYYDAFYHKEVKPLKAKVQAQLIKNLAQNDRKAKTLAQPQAYLTKANLRQAHYAYKQFNDLNATLITLATMQNKDPHHSDL